MRHLLPFSLLLIASGGMLAIWTDPNHVKEWVKWRLSLAGFLIVLGVLLLGVIVVSKEISSAGCVVGQSISAGVCVPIEEAG